LQRGGYRFVPLFVDFGPRAGTSSVMASPCHLPQRRRLMDTSANSAKNLIRLACGDPPSPGNSHSRACCAHRCGGDLIRHGFAMPPSPKGEGYDSRRFASLFRSGEPNSRASTPLGSRSSSRCFDPGNSYGRANALPTIPDAPPACFRHCRRQAPIPLGALGFSPKGEGYLRLSAACAKD